MVEPLFRDVNDIM